MLHPLRELCLLPCVGLLSLAAVPLSGAASVTVDFSSMGTVTTPVLNFPDGNITGANSGGPADVHMLNLNGLGIVGGGSNSTVDGTERMRFQFSALVDSTRYFVQLANNLNGNGLVGESTIEAFVGATSLGTVAVNSTGWKNVTTLFGGAAISSFVVSANGDGVRIGALEYNVIGTLPVAFCLGDGSATACPCANNGSAGNGCGNSVFAGGARLFSSGFAGASMGTDSLVLTATNVVGPGLFFQSTGLAASPVSFGDGQFCATVGIVRLGVVFPTGNTAIYPGGSTPNPIHIAGAPIVNSDVRHYQFWYRDAAVFCTPSTFNLTQGLTITWGP